MYPGKDKIIELHQKYAPSDKAFSLIFTHCQIIAEIAEQLIYKRKIPIDIDLVKAGALVHDIGAYKFINPHGVFQKTKYIRHGIEGHDLLIKEGFPQEVCRIAERHTGVGITQLDILVQKLPLPSKDYIAETKEEELVMYADKFHSKVPRFNSYESYMVYVNKWGKDKADKFEELSGKFGIPQLEKLAKKYNQQIV